MPAEALPDLRRVGDQGRHQHRRAGRPRRSVVLEAGPGQHEGIAVGREVSGADCLEDPSLRVHGSLIKGITVRGFEDDGVLLSCVEDWRITDVAAIDNEEYGIFPSHVFDGRLDHSFASGANDTGHYIGQSFDSRVDHNVATDNVSGFELENSVGIRADHNLSFGNTGGILSFDLPFLDAKVNSGNVIDHNVVTNNNRPNTCTDPEDTVCQVPPGTGILLMAVDENLVKANLVTGNDSYGIAVANICLAQELPEEVCAVARHRAQPGQQQRHLQRRARQRQQPGAVAAAGLRQRPRLGRDRDRQLLVQEPLRDLVPGPAAGLLSPWSRDRMGWSSIGSGHAGSARGRCSLPSSTRTSWRDGGVRVDSRSRASTSSPGSASPTGSRCSRRRAMPSICPGSSCEVVPPAGLAFTFRVGAPRSR